MGNTQTQQRPGSEYADGISYIETQLLRPGTDCTPNAFLLLFPDNMHFPALYKSRFYRCPEPWIVDNVGCRRIRVGLSSRSTEVEALGGFRRRKRRRSQRRDAEIGRDTSPRSLCARCVICTAPPEQSGIVTLRW